MKKKLATNSYSATKTINTNSTIKQQLLRTTLTRGQSKGQQQNNSEIELTLHNKNKPGNTPQQQQQTTEQP